jgi:hypothetical protein
VLGESGVVCDAVEGGRVEFGKGGMRVGAVETFLVAIDPGGFLALVGLGRGREQKGQERKVGGKGQEKKGDGHGFPVEAPGIGNAVAIRQFCEINFVS